MGLGPERLRPGHHGILPEYLLLAFFQRHSGWRFSPWARVLVHVRMLWWLVILEQLHIESICELWLASLAAASVVQRRRRLGCGGRRSCHSQWLLIWRCGRFVSGRAIALFPLLQLRFAVGVIALDSKWTSLSSVEESTHYSLILSWVGRRDSQTSLVIYCYCRLRCWCISLDGLAPSLIGRGHLALWRYLTCFRGWRWWDRHDLLRTGPITEFLTRYVVVDVGCSNLNDTVAIATLIIRRWSRSRGLYFTNFFYWPISGRWASVDGKRQLSIIRAGADPAWGQRLLLVPATLILILHVDTLLLEASL